MLFEIFFNPDAELRAKPKSRQLTAVFQLQRYAELSDSFEFIAKCLVSHEDRFHAIPGKGHTIAVDVVTQEKKSNVYVVERIFLGGANVLWMEEDFFADDAGNPTHHASLSPSEFEARLSEEMLVPAHLLKVTYAFEKSAKNALLFPLGWTTRKR